MLKSMLKKQFNIKKIAVVFYEHSVSCLLGCSQVSLKQEKTDAIKTSNKLVSFLSRKGCAPLQLRTSRPFVHVSVMGAIHFS